MKIWIFVGHSLYTVIFKFQEDKNYENLVKEFDEILLNYKQYPEFKRYVNGWKIKALFYINKTDEVWDEIIKQKDLSLDLILTSISFLDKYNIEDITGIDIINLDYPSMVGHKTLTKFGAEHKIEIGNIVTKKLHEFKKLYNEDIFTYFLNLTNQDYDHVKSFYSYKELEDYNSLDNYNKGYKKIHNFNFNYPFDLEISDFNEKKIHSFIYFALICELKRIIRESENEVRELHKNDY